MLEDEFQKAYIKLAEYKGCILQKKKKFLYVQQIGPCWVLVASYDVLMSNDSKHLAFMVLQFLSLSTLSICIHFCRCMRTLTHLYVSIYLIRFVRDLYRQCSNACVDYMVLAFIQV